jgi:Tol biopolymer transport system component
MTIAFNRVTTANVNDIYTVPLSGGAPKQITFDGHGGCSSLMWTPDGKSIVFISDRGGLASLWRVAATGGTIEPEPVYPSIGSFSNDGLRFAYADYSGTANTAIWRADLPSEGGRVLQARKFIYSQYIEDAAQPSPDGTRIVFQSGRTGSFEIWLSSAEGDNPLQLTALGRYSGSARWSPDGRWIAFDTRPKDHSQI